MEALLAAMGHDVVELDRLQVQRSECKVADKWKVELCHWAKTGCFRWAPRSSYKMENFGEMAENQWVTGVTTPISGVTTLLIPGRGPRVGIWVVS